MFRKGKGSTWRCLASKKIQERFETWIQVCEEEGLAFFCQTPVGRHSLGGSLKKVNFSMMSELPYDKGTVQSRMSCTE